MAKKDKQTFYDKVHANGGKHWNYQCVIYEDSAPLDWMTIIRSWGENVLISPYHDKDHHDDGTVKKPHYHIQIFGSTSHSYTWAIHMFQQIKGVYDDPDVVDKIEFHNKNFWDNNIIHNKVMAIRYLTHKDDPDKAQYSDADVVVIGCMDYQSLCMMAGDKYKALAEMEEWCEDNQVFSYRLLSNYAKKNKFGWYKVLVDGGHNHMFRWLRAFEYDIQTMNEAKYKNGGFDYDNSQDI